MPPCVTRATSTWPIRTSAPLPDVPSAVEILSVPFDGNSLQPLRRRLGVCAVGHGENDFTAYKFVLAVNEVVSNAVRHGGGSGHLKIWQHLDRWLVQVSDQGPGIARGYRAAPLRREPGRLGRSGLWLVNQICENITIDTGPDGTTVRMEYRLGQAAEAF